MLRVTFGYPVVFMGIPVHNPPQRIPLRVQRPHGAAHAVHRRDFARAFQALQPTSVPLQAQAPDPQPLPRRRTPIDKSGRQSADAPRAQRDVDTSQHVQNPFHNAAACAARTCGSGYETHGATQADCLRGPRGAATPLPRLRHDESDTRRYCAPSLQPWVISLLKPNLRHISTQHCVPVACNSTPVARQHNANYCKLNCGEFFFSFSQAAGALFRRAGKNKRPRKRI